MSVLDPASSAVRPLDRRTAALWLGFSAAVAYLNALFTMDNVASTLWIRLRPSLSIELLFGLALLAVYRSMAGTLRTLGRGVIAALIFVATLLRYIDVTVPGTLGRQLDSHGDLPHLPSVIGVFWAAVPTPVAVAALIGVASLAVLLMALNWLAVTAIERALALRRLRQATVALALVAGAGLILAPALPAQASLPFSQPVSAVFKRHLDSLRQPGPAQGLTLGMFDRSSAPEWGPDPSLAGLEGAHIFLIFLESYGVTLIEDPHHFAGIQPRLQSFERRLRENGFSVMSNTVLSPSFAGGSWRAHATVLSGIRLSDEHLYEALLSSNRKTLVHYLKQAGYRTVTAEPAIQSAWPEGRFFEFDAIYDAQALAYHGPTIGWWKIPDQYTLYRIFTEEIENARQPLFVKFALIMTHIPYFPIPPYVEDWSRFDSGSAYEESLPSIAADDYRDLGELSSRYIQAFIYELDILEDFIVELAPPDSLVIVAGDHQPPKLATHDNDSWAVPMQLISRRKDLVEPFREHGFRDGMVPRHPSDFAMEEFLPAFLEAFRGS